jgi:riboflavin kinase/FMN adenylyltransferase
VEVIDGVDALPAGLRFVATLGIFDGMHRGHAAVLATTARHAAELDAVPVVITFEPHPDAVLRGTTPPLCCDADEKLTRIGASGIATVVVQPFDAAFSQQSAEDFVERLRRGRDLRGLVMSSESAFGHDRAGTARTLRHLAEEEGWRLVELPTLERAGGRVSAGRIRELVERGRLRAAADLLGRPYAVTGEVVHGDARGRELGFPTANLRFPADVALPPNGIYAVRAAWGGDDPLSPEHTADGVASLGVRPTFGGGGNRLLEVHLLDFDGDLYGEDMRVEFVRRQRGEKRFGSADALVRQMERDRERAREILAASR